MTTAEGQTPSEELPFAIVGAGIGGLALALELSEAGVPFRIFELTREMGEAGVGINVLPHASQELSRFGIEDRLASRGVLQQRARYFTRFGQLIYEEPLGKFGGYGHPQISIHRNELRTVLHEAVQERGGVIELDRRCVGFEQDDDGVTIHFQSSDGSRAPTERVRGVIACDGIHSAVRKQLYPDEGAPIYSGVSMWRGVTRHPPVQGGATMMHLGWLRSGKMVIYPIRDAIDDDENQLINWVCEAETESYRESNWGQPGNFEDFLPKYADWKFDWFDVPSFIQAADLVLEYPMVDRDPLLQWSFGRVTLLGDAAHPMVPRGANGANQAILDAKSMGEVLAQHAEDPVQAFREYEEARREATSRVVLTNRVAPPDTILRMVYERSGDKPFDKIEDLFAPGELREVLDNYKSVAGFTKEGLAQREQMETKSAS